MRVRLDVTRPSAAAEPSRPAPAPTGIRPSASTGREVAPRRTALSPAEIRAALAGAHQKLHGSAIAPRQLDVLAAQVSHETALGASMHNFNFGGIKGTSPEGLTARCRTKEILGGQERAIVDGFRAYRSAEAGATDYLSFVERKYPAAWEAAKRGDVDGFVHALKARGYFTADEAGYATAVRSVLGRMDQGSAPLLASTTPVASARGQLDAPASLPEGPTSVALVRVLDAIATTSARIADPRGEDSSREV